MAVVFFQVQLSVQPKEAGEAELVFPIVLQDLNPQFVAVKEGGNEGIVKLDVSEANLKKVEKEKSCKKLTEAQMEALKKSYPVPKLKQKYRSPSPAEMETSSESFALDDRGNRIIDTWQTVRSGFYLIDVPVLTQV
jgi:hypothetical protein